MTNTYKSLAWVTLVLLVGLGLKVLTAGQPKFGDSLVSTVATHYINGIKAGTSDQFSVSGAGVVTTSGGITNTGSETVSGTVSAKQYSTATNGTASTSPAALGSASAGHIAVPAGATVVSASTTSITANSEIFLQYEKQTPTVSTTCNTTAPTSTPAITTIYPGSGFVVTLANSPITNPVCLAFRILN